MLIQGSTAYIGFNMSREDQSRINLSGATVEFIFKRDRKGENITKTCKIEDPLNGTCSLMLTPEDLSTAGTYLYQLKVTFSDLTVIKSGITGFYVEESL